MSEQEIAELVRLGTSEQQADRTLYRIHAAMALPRLLEERKRLLEACKDAVEVVDLLPTGEIPMAEDAIAFAEAPSAP